MKADLAGTGRVLFVVVTLVEVVVVDAVEDSDEPLPTPRAGASLK